MLGNWTLWYSYNRDAVEKLLPDCCLTDAAVRVLLWLTTHESSRVTD